MTLKIDVNDLRRDVAGINDIASLRDLFLQLIDVFVDHRHSLDSGATTSEPKYYADPYEFRDD